MNGNSHALLDSAVSSHPLSKQSRRSQQLCPRAGKEIAKALKNKEEEKERRQIAADNKGKSASGGSLGGYALSSWAAGEVQLERAEQCRAQGRRSNKSAGAILISQGLQGEGILFSLQIAKAACFILIKKIFLCWTEVFLKNMLGY